MQSRMQKRPGEVGAGDLTARGTLRDDVRSMMERHWTEWNYTVPHATAYPYQWLWDSCFHTLIWGELGDERAVTEIASVFRHQKPSGFVPHITYDAAPQVHAPLWRRDGTSSVTQPPMYGHAIAELTRRSFEVPQDTIDRATKAFRHLLQHRRRVGGLVPILHPWESGADDSPRWDTWFERSDGPRGRARVKGELVAALEYGPDGSPIGSSAFAVGAASFNGLVAFNAFELGSVTGDEQLRDDAAELAAALQAQWSDEIGTWIDTGWSSPGSGRIRTLEALLPALVTPTGVPDSVFRQDGHGTDFGPSGVHVGESAYAPGAYWRGSTWPQLTYLLAVAAERAGEREGGARLRQALQAGAMKSGLAEHWHAETGMPLGSAPQSWTGLAIVTPVTAGVSG